MGRCRRAGAAGTCARLPSPPETPLPHDRPHHLLLVEDDPRWSEPLRAELGRAGCAVTLASDGAAALRSLQRRPVLQPDLVVMDLVMPGMDGWSLYGALRRDPQLRQLPVLMMSERGGQDVAVGGVVGFLHKAGGTDAVVGALQERLARLPARVPAPDGEPYALEVPEAEALALQALPAPERHAVRLHVLRAAELAGTELPMASSWLMALPGDPPCLLVDVEGVRVVLEVFTHERRLRVAAVLPHARLRGT